QIRYPIEESGKTSWKIDPEVREESLTYEHTFTWTVDVRVAPTAPIGPQKLTVVVTKMQVCNPQSCYVGSITAEASLEVESGPVATPSDLKEATKPPAQVTIPVPTGVALDFGLGTAAATRGTADRQSPSSGKSDAPGGQEGPGATGTPQQTSLGGFLFTA